jgi:hypothetical protein
MSTTVYQKNSPPMHQIPGVGTDIEKPAAVKRSDA